MKISMKDWLNLDWRRCLLPAATSFWGLALTHYLGADERMAAAVLGWLWLLTLGAGAAWLERYFRAEAAPAQRRQWLLWLGAVWTLWGALTLLLLLNGWVTAAAWILLALMLALALADVLPPLRLASRGFNGIALSVWAGFAAPAWLFVLARGSWQRWLLLFGLPLTLTFLAASLAWDFSTFAADLRRARRTLLTRLNWQNALSLHHLLLLSAFALLIFNIALGVPRAMVSPLFFAAPLAFYQIWMLKNIADGLPPPWQALKINALAIPLTVSYLLTVSLLVH